MVNRKTDGSSQTVSALHRKQNGTRGEMCGWKEVPLKRVNVTWRAGPACLRQRSGPQGPGCVRLVPGRTDNGL